MSGTLNSVSAVVALGSNNAATPSGYWSGMVGEVLIYPSTLTLAEILRVESYLLHKWNIYS